MGCSVQGNIGAVEAFLYEHPDESGKAPEIYFTYRLKTGGSLQGRAIKRNSSPDGDDDSNDVVVTGNQEWQVIAEIHLYNSEAGFFELGGCAIAAEADDEFKYILRHGGLSVVSHSAEVDDISKNDPEDPTKKEYHHKMSVRFSVNVGFQHTKINHRVREINTDGAFPPIE